MIDINNFIDEMTNDILNQKRALDMPIFLNFLKEELENVGIALTIKRQKTPIVAGNHIVASDIAGIQLDLSEHDREKDTEIEKYKKAFESAKCERDKAVCDYQTEIDRSESRIKELETENAELRCEIQAMNVYPDESICEPIKMADWIVHRFKQGLYPGYERDHNKNIKYVEIGESKIPLQTGEYENYTEVREIADYLLAYCKYHSEE